MLIVIFVVWHQTIVFVDAIVLFVVWHQTKLFLLMQVDYEFEATRGRFERLCGSDEKFCSNLSILLSWSPFGTELELQKQVCIIDLFLLLYLHRLLSILYMCTDKFINFKCFLSNATYVEHVVDACSIRVRRF